MGMSVAYTDRRNSRSHVWVEKPELSIWSGLPGDEHQTQSVKSGRTCCGFGVARVSLDTTSCQHTAVAAAAQRTYLDRITQRSARAVGLHSFQVLEADSSIREGCCQQCALCLSIRCCETGAPSILPHAAPQDINTANVVAQRGGTTRLTASIAVSASIECVATSQD
eukprot:scaffold39667_cov112-Isochrysis_galbana.AAC.6